MTRTIEQNAAALEIAMTHIKSDLNNSEWRVGDNEGKTWTVYRWCDSRVIKCRNATGNTKAFRSRAAAQASADDMNDDLAKQLCGLRPD